MARTRVLVVDDSVVIRRLVTDALSRGDRDLARAQFAGLPADFKSRMAALDYAAAERACPHGLPIARLMKEAGELLA